MMVQMCSWLDCPLRERRLDHVTWQPVAWVGLGREPKHDRDSKAVLNKIRRRSIENKEIKTAQFLCCVTERAERVIMKFKLGPKFPFLSLYASQTHR
jgi:hypothetical protein